MAWQELFVEAKKLLQESKHFDGVQKINSCMELFETEVGSSGCKILREPDSFLAEFLPKMSPEQKSAALNMFATQGDLLMGLGASKRAAIESANAADGNVESESCRNLGQNADNKIPCTVLTGLSASGKTALVNHILRANCGKHIAVIENGSIAGKENIMKINQDGMCYAVRVMSGLKKLIKISKKNGKPLDAVLIETDGLADPAPIVQALFADDFLQKHIRLDGILTLVDAKHVIQHLEDEKPGTVENAAVKQIAFADRILLSKCDQMRYEAELAGIEKRIRAINGWVPIKRATIDEVEMDFILDIRGFSLDEGTEMNGAFLEDNYDHKYDSRVNCVRLDIPGEGVQEKLNEWFCWLLKEKGGDLFRSQGVLAVKGMNEKFVFQSIHTLFANSQQGVWTKSEERRCKMFFIGRSLNREELTSGFLKCMAKPWN